MFLTRFEEYLFFSRYLPGKSLLKSVSDLLEIFFKKDFFSRVQISLVIKISNNLVRWWRLMQQKQKILCLINTAIPRSTLLYCGQLSLVNASSFKSFRARRPTVISLTDTFRDVQSEDIRELFVS